MSGNPNGRPRLPPALRAALPEAIEELIALCKSTDPTIRLRAVERVISWNIGQPGVAQADEPEDLRAWFNEALKAHDFVVLRRGSLTQEQVEAHTKGMEDGSK
jgi:hypothetical protein